MIFHPSILALYVASILISFMVLYSAYYGFQILRRWDIQSGSEAQLVLERKTYLISTLLTYVFGFELLSLFLYIFTVDRLHTFFAGVGQAKTRPMGERKKTLSPDLCGRLGQHVSGHRGNEADE